MSSPSIHVDPIRTISKIDPRIYSGFIEHMGRCIYGGIYDPTSPLSDPKTGWRLDVMEALKELRVQVVRYPGGNFVSSYRWQDGVGPRELRPRRPDLAWLSEESNEFGTDEFMAWCRALDAEPYICLNMGTGTLEDALAWLEYCNSSATTYYANLRRKNGHEEPYGVKYWALGNEVWGPWQVGQQESHDYAKNAFQWAKAMRLLDPSIKIIGCGESGVSDWDRVVLRKLAPVIDFHSIHLYTLSEGSHAVNVMGPAAAERAIEVTKSLIDLAKIEAGLSRDITVCFDEWNVWDPVRAPGEKGAEERYDLSDALAVACWLNVFIRKADIVKMACIAQSVNVISPIMTTPTSLLRQSTYYPLHLFATLMQGIALSIHIEGSPVYNGPTVPKFVQLLEVGRSKEDGSSLVKWIDVSGVLNNQAGQGREIRLAIVNRHEMIEFEVPILFSGLGREEAVEENVKVYEVWSPNLKDSNAVGDEKVRTVVREEKWDRVTSWKLKKHSFQVLVFKLAKT